MELKSQALLELGDPHRALHWDGLLGLLLLAHAKTISQFLLYYLFHGRLVHP